MRSASRKAHGERGFTLVELLAVLLILGGLTSVVALAITRFQGKGTAEAANTEFHNASVAISTCMVEAGETQLDIGAPVRWDGSEDVITATSDGGVVYDASASLRGKRLKATYTVTPTGEITGVTEQEWSGITWVDSHWEK
jgi:prepilin-type N-terminal cleavage/methylation domain-containing protein